MRAFSSASLVAAALLVAGCSVTPSVAEYKPKTAADCPGQKACGYRCVELDDPAAGCTADTCTPCPAGAANTAPVCAAQACGLVCLPGFAVQDGDPSHGCTAATGADSCGAVGHACAAGQSCTDGLCPAVTVVADTGVNPRGLTVTPTSLVWAVDPPVPAGNAAVGALRRAALDGTGVKDLAGPFGAPTFVRSGGGELVALAGKDADPSWPYGQVWLVDPGQSPASARVLGGGSDGVITGAVLLPDLLVNTISTMVEYSSLDGNSTGVIEFHPEQLNGLGQGAGFVWLGGTAGVYRLTADASGADTVGAGGIYFDELPTPWPVPQRIAAHPGPTASDPLVVYFADLSTGSIWTGRTTGRAGTAGFVSPWRLVRGAGPRTQMDVAADDAGVVWSDHDAGEIWSLPKGAAQPFLLARGRPWAIAITATRVYWTDTELKAVRWVAR
jgi:hypothetical protein